MEYVAVDQAQLERELMDAGFTCVASSYEYPHNGAEGAVKICAGEPQSYDKNNGVGVIYDAGGMPWVIVLRGYTATESWKEIVRKYGHRMGGYVPHSNSCGRECGLCHLKN